MLIFFVCFVARSVYRSLSTSGSKTSVHVFASTKNDMFKRQAELEQIEADAVAPASTGGGGNDKAFEKSLSNRRLPQPPPKKSSSSSSSASASASAAATTPNTSVVRKLAKQQQQQSELATKPSSVNTFVTNDGSEMYVCLT